MKTEELLREYATLAGKDDAASEARKNETIAYLETHTDDAGREKAQAFLTRKLDDLQADVDTLRKRIDDEDYRILPLSYIATHYFGKSAAWLSQRINGTPIRGKSYTLNEEQKRIFNDALSDISRRIGALRLT